MDPCVVTARLGGAMADDLTSRLREFLDACTVLPQGESGDRAGARPSVSDMGRPESARLRATP